ncbi:fasciclin domain-containing protein [Geomonas sp. RF6]|uniref:fasciclin domain-containing protein n=1 Tax=Geomonas sp. RF6 TaxID=2897342 RepID=UPI001E37C891|nr:fasciclin domain-containing protein [Geomonas sp. RF6]UFS70041.1 fasciclin domain-containing protein [Geomonas sp. RF6]
MKDILETLTEDGSFSTLIAALNTTGLADKLKEAGPFTFFAPNDEAFRRVNVDEMARDKGTFTNILLYHLMTGKMMSSDIGAHESLYTECGKSLTVHLEEGRPVIDNAKYVRPDVECSNGVIHVIDNVFLPQFSGWYCGCC